VATVHCNILSKGHSMKRKLVWIVIVLVVLGGALTIAMPRIKAYAKQRIYFVIQNIVKENRRDISGQMDNIAAEQTARFVMETMPKVPRFPDRLALMDYSLKAVDPEAEGLYCEFGVWTGLTVNHIASRTDRTIHGFDSFEGLPEDWRTRYPKGTFSLEGLPKVAKNVELHKGWFNESLPGWAEENPGPIVFIHFDADLYSSTKTVLDILADRIVPGTVIQFDEYFNYPGWQEGEYKAFKEFVEARDVKFEYIGYCEADDQVAVRIVSVGSQGEE
jgi:Methyltransferase domain